MHKVKPFGILPAQRSNSVPSLSEFVPAVCVNIVLTRVSDVQLLGWLHVNPKEHTETQNHWTLCGIPWQLVELLATQSWNGGLEFRWFHRIVVHCVRRR
jgi:hypothetical protein